jgi:hypothetical protein
MQNVQIHELTARRTQSEDNSIFLVKFLALAKVFSVKVLATPEAPLLGVQREQESNIA